MAAPFQRVGAEPLECRENPCADKEDQARDYVGFRVPSRSTDTLHLASPGQDEVTLNLKDIHPLASASSECLEVSMACTMKRRPRSECLPTS